MEEQIIQKVAEHDVRIGTLEENQKELTHRVEDIHKIATSVELIANNVDHMKGDVSELKAGQTELKIIWLVVGGVVAFILAQLLPNIFSK